MKKMTINQSRLYKRHVCVRRSGWLLAACSVLSCTTALAGAFISGAYINSQINIAEQTYSPNLSRLSLGWQFTPRFAVEMSAATSLSADQIASTELDIETLQSVLMRYSTPVSSSSSAYVMLGYNQFDLAAQGATFTLQETYSDTLWGFGFEERAYKKSGTRVFLEYQIHYRDQAMKADSLQLGLRYLFE